MTSDRDPDVRRVLLIAHTGRDDARVIAGQFCRSLYAHDIALRLLEDEAPELGLDLDYVEVVKPTADAGRDCELVLVIGGDGTILRAAELARECGTPLLGVNLGHVGFLAEAEVDDVDITIEAIVHRRYVAEERLTLDVSVYRDVTGDGRAGRLDLGAQRGQRREGGPGADARGGRRGRRATAVPLGLRRGRVRDTDRLDRLQLQRRRPDRLAECRGPAAWCRSVRTRCSRVRWSCRRRRCSRSR